jgi:deoxyadenosine/deoxycytidine kinase
MEVPDEPRKAKASVIIIEGEIGAGKTELAKAMAATLKGRGLNVCVVFEPVGQWEKAGALQLFYSDPARHAYGFQSYVYATRIMAITAAFVGNPVADIFILERSPATDLIFMELQREAAGPVAMQMYGTWCGAWRRMLPIDLGAARVLYLKTSLENCMLRVAGRGRTGEVAASKPAGVSAEYQARLRRAHEAFFCGLHAEEFPLMPPSPFPRTAVVELGPDIADGNFLDEGPERDRIVAAVIEKAGLALPPGGRYI